MSDEQTPATSASLPTIDDVQKMSSSQASAAKAAVLAQQEISSKYLSGHVASRQLVETLVDREINGDVAEVIATVAASSAALPLPGGANDADGLSYRDRVEGARWLVDDGLGADEVAEYYSGRAQVPPEDYPKVKRELDYCRNHPEISKRWLAGDPDVKRYMLRLHMILQRSRPLPEAPTVGVVNYGPSRYRSVQ